MSLVSVAGIVGAQSSDGDVYITWRARTYVPALYAGRALPIANSLVTADVALIQNGRVVDLSGENIFWYLDDNLLGGGTGLQEISFNMPEVAGAIVDLRAEIGGSLLKTITLQAASPQVMIAPVLPGDILTSSQITLRAVPYFFNTGRDKLGYNWLINNQPPETSEAPQELVLTIRPGTAAGFRIDLQAAVSNARYLFESATKNLTLTFSP